MNNNTCSICNRKFVAGHREVCFECYEIAGLDNEAGENNLDDATFFSAFTEAMELMDRAVRLGGDRMKITNTFQNIFSDN